MEPQLKPVPIDSAQPAWQQPAPPAQSGATIVTSDQQKNVLRNTYWLLALSMLPTIAGAWFGTSINFAGVVQDVADHGAAADVRRDVRHAVRRLGAAQQQLGRARDVRLHVRRRA